MGGYPVVVRQRELYSQSELEVRLSLGLLQSTRYTCVNDLNTEGRETYYMM